MQSYVVQYPTPPQQLALAMYSHVVIPTHLLFVQPYITALACEGATPPKCRMAAVATAARPVLSILMLRPFVDGLQQDSVSRWTDRARVGATKAIADAGRFQTGAVDL